VGRAQRIGSSAWSRRGASWPPGAELPSELNCLSGVLPPATLHAAAARASALGIGADRVLIALGIISEDAYLQRLSLRSGIKIADFSTLSRAEINVDDAAVHLAAQSGLLPLRQGGRTLIVITPRHLASRGLAGIAAGRPREIGHLRLASEKAMQDLLLYRCAGVVEEAVGGLSRRQPGLSAAPAPRRGAASHLRRSLAIAVVASVLAGIVSWPGAAADIAALLFLACIMLRVVAAGLPPARSARPCDLSDSLPTYTLLVPLYREAPSVPQLLASLLALDYPREKLDIILVVETDDLATRAAIARQSPPACVRVVVAPDYGPRTKPKALNVALPFARGSLVAVYDAEDRPEPQQLRMAVAAFRAGDDRLACVQASLAIDNASDGVLPAMFAAEYAAQFDLVMPGYGRLGLPWPLGGTSNHFRTDVLRAIGAWDAFNVTEDADLGLRLARFGYRIEMIASTTFEEAPIGWRAWRNQRTRWMKGWMQSWWVHAREPVRFSRAAGWRGLAARDLMIGGALLAALAAPLLPVTALLWATGLYGEEPLFSPLHQISAAAGLAATMAMWLRALKRRNLLRHAWVIALVPLHWALLSLAAWRALLQLRNEPYRWEKTEHGLAITRHSAGDAGDQAAPADRTLRSARNGAADRRHLPRASA
jgi:cellulose synthase/poly-beta-1,6-N-acetylglucosamine synthase-like glycosyltransferase